MAIINSRLPVVGDPERDARIAEAKRLGTFERTRAEYNANNPNFVMDESGTIVPAAQARRTQRVAAAKEQGTFDQTRADFNANNPGRVMDRSGNIAIVADGGQRPSRLPNGLPAQGYAGTPLAGLSNAEVADVFDRNPALKPQGFTRLPVTTPQAPLFQPAAPVSAPPVTAPMQGSTEGQLKTFSGDAFSEMKPRFTPAEPISETPASAPADIASEASRYNAARGLLSRTDMLLDPESQRAAQRIVDRVESEYDTEEGERKTIEAQARAMAIKAEASALQAREKAQAQRIASKAKADEATAKADATVRANESKVALLNAQSTASRLKDLIDQRREQAARSPAAVSSRLQGIFSGQRGPRGK